MKTDQQMFEVNLTSKSKSNFYCVITLLSNFIMHNILQSRYRSNETSTAS